MSIAQTVSNLAEQVQMLVQKNRTRNVVAGGRTKDEGNGGDEINAPAASHFHPCSDPRDSRCCQPIDTLSERERRPARSASVFDWLGDEADSDQMRAQFCDGRTTRSLEKDPRCEPGYSYDDEEYDHKCKWKPSTGFPTSKLACNSLPSGYFSKLAPTIDSYLEELLNPKIDETVKEERSRLPNIDM
ncbi:hypothetical protein Fot_37956 [Forsythia ovata]|uniref:Uncharacterized protein n=1 Tax=Forsythia ovata TaxID=205694 RepID=A0ABD1S4H4_9LAMI